jgi:multiple sugar transport system permease protein
LRPLLWFAPVLVLLLTVTLYPTVFVVWMSFQKTRYYDLAGFVGLANYVDTLSSRAFWETTYTSLVYMVGSLVLSLGLGVLAALVLNSLKRGGAVLRVLTLVPWTLSMAVVGTMWLWLFNPSYGPISYFMRTLGMAPGLMLGDPELALWLTVLVTSWWSFPYAMVIVTAAIQSIPTELYEAVSIDGGSWRAKFRYVTFPHLVPTLGSTALTLGIVYLTLITLLIVLTGGGPIGATTTLSFEVFRGTVQAVNIGPTAVYSIAILLANVALGVLYMRLTGRVTA